MTDLSTLTGEESCEGRLEGGTPEALAFVIAWSPGQPGRVGEVGIVPPTRDLTLAIGRGASVYEGGHERLEFLRAREDSLEPRPPLASRRISRLQLRVRGHGTQSLRVENVGRCPLKHNGMRAVSATVVPGDTLQIGHELLLLCVRRPAWTPSPQPGPAPMAFGHSDAHGIVGEAPSMWTLRRQIAFAAQRAVHVLIVGESGTGKELVAKALHALSPRSHLPLVARNAATFPEGLVDAELFGHARNYPSAGMLERQGVVGQAAGGTLFLDELAELPVTLQTHLLRVLDGGEYHRLGESTVQVSNFRLLGATNRPSALRPDLAARLKLSVRLPSLNERREDIPLLAIHTLRGIARQHRDIGDRLFPSGNLEEEPRISIDLVDALVRRPYTTHVRELEALLWEALAAGEEPILGVPRSAFAPADEGGPCTRRAGAPRKVSAEEIDAALADNDGSIERTRCALGLTSRHALARLMAKHGIRKGKRVGADG